MNKRWMICIGLAALALACAAPSAMALGTPAGTTISNTAYADYKDANGNNMPRVTSTPVTTTVTQVAGVDVSPETSSKTGLAGGTVYYAATVTNTGNGPDTLALAVTDSAGGWTSKIYFDADGDGVWDTGETTEVTSTGLLAADGTYKVIVVTSIPAGTANGASDTATLTATSGYSGGVSDSGAYTTTAQTAVLSCVKAVTFPDPDGDGVEPGAVMTFSITGQNSGSAAAENVAIEDVIPTNTTYVAGSMRYGPVGGSYATATALTDGSDTDSGLYNGTKVVFTKGTCNPGDTAVFYFQATVNSGVLQGTTITNFSTTTYNLVGVPVPTYDTTSNTTSSAVGFYGSIQLNPNRTGTADPGDTVIYRFDAINNGNAADRIDIASTSSTGGWTWQIWVDLDNNGIVDNGDYQLTDTDANGFVDTGLLAANGGTAHLLAVTTIPAGLADGSTDTTTITGRSATDTTVTDPEVLTTTITAPSLSIVKTVTPVGPQPPGAVLTYTITLTNNGTGNATAVITTDVVPTHTTYQPGTIKTGATVGTLTDRTDDVGDDDGQVSGGAVVGGALGGVTLGPGGTYVLRFDVKID